MPLASCQLTQTIFIPYHHVEWDNRYFQQWAGYYCHTKSLQKPGANSGIHRFVPCTIYQCRHTNRSYERFSCSTEFASFQISGSMLWLSFCNTWSKMWCSHKIAHVEQRAVYTHCYRHSINLAVSDAVRETSAMKDSLIVTHGITKLTTPSPQRGHCYGSLSMPKVSLLHQEYRWFVQQGGLYMHCA